MGGDLHNGMSAFKWQESSNPRELPERHTDWGNQPKELSSIAFLSATFLMFFNLGKK